MKQIKLTNLDWQVKGYWPWVPLQQRSMEIGQELLGVTDWIPATVPGGVHYDLYRAGLIEHPYKDVNSLKCEWVENRWWLYRTTITRPLEEAVKYELMFTGLDYEAGIYINGQLVSNHIGMYTFATVDVTSFFINNETIELAVLFQHAPDEMAQIGRTSQTFTQKSRFNYKWDFSTRLVNIGIWDDIVLNAHQQFSIDDLYIRTDVRFQSSTLTQTQSITHTETGIVSINAQIVQHGHDTSKHPLQIRASLFDRDNALVTSSTVQLEDKTLSMLLEIENPHLWYPNGYGEQPLYRLELQLINENDHIYDVQQLKIGIRSLSYELNDNSPDDALPYTMVVNGKRIYVKGVNITPLDHLYGNVSDSHYEWIVHLMKQGNINMARVWGGGIIEKLKFYELCDEFGILIWQEFIQSSSGIDNIPSKRPEFLHLLKQAASSAIKRRRNHVALTVWSGGNELMSEQNRPSTLEDENLAMLLQLVQTLDSQRLFLPTSASGPVEYITDEKGISHDVHGHWKYIGDPQHYHLYGDNDNLFHSEFGVDGVSTLKSLRKFLSEEHLKPVSMKNNLIWRHHGEWWDTLERDEQLFGSFEDLQSFSLASQWMQAEGLRFILEANRRRKFQNSGSIIWQLNEPWPNASCTNLVDYYGETKMAYYWVKKAYSPSHVSLDYRTLAYMSGEHFQAPIFVHHAGGTGQAVVDLEVLNTKGQVLYATSFGGELKRDLSLNIGVASFIVPTIEDGLLFVRLSANIDQQQLAASNLYIFSTRSAPIYDYKSIPSSANVISERLYEWTDVAVGKLFTTYRIYNNGTTAALHIRAEELTDFYWIEASDMYFTLMPGETKEISVHAIIKRGGGFLTSEWEDNIPLPQLPDISFSCFTSK